MSILTTLLVLFTGSWLAATISGAAGFGGALLLLPVITHLIGLESAVPVLTIAQIWGNGSRIWFGRREIKWESVGYFIVTAIPFSLIGSWLFVDLPRRWILVGIGFFLLLIVLWRRLKVTRFTISPKGLLWGGAVTGFLSGIAGSAGPLGAAFFLGLELPAAAYVASEAVTALAMHLSKTIVYQRYALLGVQELGYGLLMGAGMVLGSWSGKQIITRLPREKFILLVELLLLISALQLIFFSD